jgi:hypothetical protein
MENNQPSQTAHSNRSLSPVRTRAYGSQDKCGYPIVLESLEKTKKNDLILVHMFNFTNSDFANLLKKQANKGVSVELITDGPEEKNKRTFECLESIKNTPINICTFNQSNQMHLKTVAWTYTDENDQQQFRTWSGSYNITNKAAHNLEEMVYDLDQATFNYAQKEHKWLKKFCIRLGVNESPDWQWSQLLAKRISLSEIPQRQRRISSLAFDINKTIAAIFDKADNKLLINLYNIDNVDLLKLLVKKSRQKVLNQLNTNYTPLDNGIALSGLIYAAKYGALVKIFNHDQSKKFVSKYPVDNHAKMFALRQKDGSTLVGVGSANFTDYNNNAVNSWTFYPNNNELIEHIENGIADIGKRSVDILSISQLKPTIKSVENKIAERNNKSLKKNNKKT